MVNHSPEEEDAEPRVQHGGSLDRIHVQGMPISGLLLLKFLHGIALPTSQSDVKAATILFAGTEHAWAIMVF